MGVQSSVDVTFHKDTKVTDTNVDLSWDIYNDPKSKTGFSFGNVATSDKADKKLKWKYNDDNPHADDTSNMKLPTEFIPRKDLNQIPKNKKKLINYIPGTESY